MPVSTTEVALVLPFTGVQSLFERVRFGSWVQCADDAVTRSLIIGCSSSNSEISESSEPSPSPNRVDSPGKENEKLGARLGVPLADEINGALCRLTGPSSQTADWRISGTSFPSLKAGSETEVGEEHLSPARGTGVASDMAKSSTSVL